jgi:O-antigen ligase
VFEATPRVRGTFGDPSHFGTYLLIVGAAALASGVAAFRRGATWVAIGLGALLVCILAAIFGTYSRSAWLGFVGAIAILTLSLWHRLVTDPAGTRRAAVLPLVVACSFIALTAPFASAINVRLDPSSAGNVVSNSVHERTMTVALDDLIGYPLTGIGIADLGPQLEQAVRSSGAHSSYLTVAAELGAPGLLLLLLGLALTLRMLQQRMGASTDPDRLVLRGLAAGYIGFAIANLSYDLWWDDFHWLVLGLIIAACSDRSAGDAPR